MKVCKNPKIICSCDKISLPYAMRVETPVLMRKVGRRNNFCREILLSCLDFCYRRKLISS